MKKVLLLFCLSLSFNLFSQQVNWFNWSTLKNPVYTYKNWSVKDACMIYKDSVFYIFFSAFFIDDSIERSHVSCVKTKDFIHFSEPLFIWDGKKEGWLGMCSPSICKIDNKYYLTYNSWGDKKDKVNQLFYAVSDDLTHWKKDLSLAENLTNGYRAIDAEIIFYNNYYILTWKESKSFNNLKRLDLIRMAYSKNLDSNFKMIYSGYADFIMDSGYYSNKTHENLQFIFIDNKAHILCTDYVPHNPYIYQIEGNANEIGNWLKWINGRKLNIPIEEFNISHTANAAYLVDWRSFDGYFYLLYAGNTENKSHAGRGDNKLGLSRSKDLINWIEAGK